MFSPAMMRCDVVVTSDGSMEDHDWSPGLGAPPAERLSELNPKSAPGELRDMADILFCVGVLRAAS